MSGLHCDIFDTSVAFLSYLRPLDATSWREKNEKTTGHVKTALTLHQKTKETTNKKYNYEKSYY